MWTQISRQCYLRSVTRKKIFGHMHTVYIQINQRNLTWELHCPLFLTNTESYWSVSEQSISDQTACRRKLRWKYTARIICPRTPFRMTCQIHVIIHTLHVLYNVSCYTGVSVSPTRSGSYGDCQQLLIGEDPVYVHKGDRRPSQRCSRFSSDNHILHYMLLYLYYRNTFFFQKKIAVQ